MRLPPLKDWTTRHWLIAIAVATAALAGLFGYLLARSLRQLGEDPQLPALLRRAGNEQSLYARIRATEAQIAEQEAVAARYAERKALLDGMKHDIAAARRRLPSEAQKPEMSQLIYDLARQVQGSVGTFTIASLAIQEAGQGQGGRGRQDYQTVVYQVTANADFDSILAFINLVERNDRFMTLDGIQITSGGVQVERDSGVLTYKPHTVQLRIVTYVDTTVGGERRR